MLSRLRLLTLLLLTLLTACNQATTPKDTTPTGNTPPASLQAVADTYTFTQGALSLVGKDKGVLINDTVPQTFELAVSANPEHGTLELNQDGSFSYQHDSSETNQDSFSYTITASGKTATAIVTLMLEAAPVTPPDSPTSPDAPRCVTSMQSGQSLECWLASFGATNYALENAPVGMVIQQRSGLLRWTPTTTQVGDYQFTVTNDKGEKETFALTITPGTPDPVGLYVSPDGNDANIGSAEFPFKTLQQAVKKATPGATIYLRGGTYFNADYGKPFDGNPSSNVIAKITMSGTAEKPITLRPYGNEFVTLKTDESGLLFLSANYWIVEGLELVGSTQEIDYDEAMSVWWQDGSSLTSGRGIANNNSQHIIIRNCIIHDFPGAGIGINGADFITVQDNIIYNNAWWTIAGTNGVATAYMTTTDPATDDQEKLIMTGNLVFGNQSLIISHVFSKGKVALTIDEGNGLHAQNDRRTFQGKARVENNLLLFNGKGGFGINTMDAITVRNNSFYLNAAVVESAGELTIQSSTATDVSNNLFMPRANRLTIKDFQKSYANVGANITTGSLEGLPASITQSLQVFRAPEQLDFRPAAGIAETMGVPEAELGRMFAIVKAYGITITAPRQMVNDNYLTRMKQTIFDTWPASYSNLVLEDKETGFVYSYAQRCHYPAAPSTTPCL